MPLDRNPFAAQRDREMSRLDLAKFERPARPWPPIPKARLLAKYQRGQGPDVIGNHSRPSIDTFPSFHATRNRVGGPA
jgi:hypothetical protein